MQQCWNEMECVLPDQSSPDPADPVPAEEDIHSPTLTHGSETHVAMITHFSLKRVALAATVLVCWIPPRRKCVVLLAPGMTSGIEAEMSHTHLPAASPILPPLLSSLSSLQSNPINGRPTRSGRPCCPSCARPRQLRPPTTLRALPCTPFWCRRASHAMLP